MLNTGRLLIAAILALSLAGCSMPANFPAETPAAPGTVANPAEAVTPSPSEQGLPETPAPDFNTAKMSAKDFIKAYYDALNARDYDKALMFWSEKAGKTADSLKIPDGVSNIFVLKTTLMSLSNADEIDMATLQVTADPSVTGEWRNGKITRWFYFTRTGDFKITEIK